jgi:hypothetical protein
MANPKDKLKPITPIAEQNIQWNMALMEKHDGKKYLHIEIVAISGMVVVMDIPCDAGISIGNELANLGKMGNLGLTIVEGQ